MYEELRKKVLKANKMLPEYGLVSFTWGNVSEIDRKEGIIAIKPSGIEYDEMTEDDIVIVDINGAKIWGDRKPSSDLLTHIVLYRSFKNIGGVTHTHSSWATAWAQSGLDIPALGTTHGDYFYGDIPCTRRMTEREIVDNYEENTGVVIAERFKNINEDTMPAVLVNCHGVFTWGRDAVKSVENAAVLEEVAKCAYASEQLRGNNAEKMDKALLDKHYLRKHGDNAYYGQ